MSGGASWRGSAPKKVRAGWWFWFPFLFGIFFTVGGILALIGSSLADSSAQGGLTVTSITFLVLGVGSLLVAWWSWRDIHSQDPDPELPGELGDAAAADLDAHGVVGSATVQDFSYVAGTSRDGTLLVNLVLDIATVGLGTRQVRHQTRIGRADTQRLGKGSTVPVTVSPTNPGAIRVDWSGLVAAL